MTKIREGKCKELECVYREDSTKQRVSKKSSSSDLIVSEKLINVNFAIERCSLPGGFRLAMIQ